MRVIPDRALSLGLRIAGLTATLLVALPLFFERGIPVSRLIAWSGATATFAACFWIGAGAVACGRRAALLPMQVACVVGMVLLLCDGFEGSLLVLVALQLAGYVGWRVGTAVILAQTTALAAAVATHWSGRPALLLAPPYLGFQLLAFAVARLLVQQTRIAEELVAARGMVEQNTRLAERVRIARDLHDAVGHRLTALRLHLEAATRTAQDAATATACRTAYSLAGDVLSDIREAVDTLRDDGGIDLATALRAIADQVPAPPRVHLTLPAAIVCPDGARRIALLRCAQEIVTNAARHSRAENLWIDLMERDGSIELSARDDGRGAEALVTGAGLRGMRERVEGVGGRLELETNPGQGFSLRARVPAGAT